MLKLKRTLRHLPILTLTLTLGALLAIPQTAAAAPKNQTRDICIVHRGTSGLANYALVFQDVPPLVPERVISLRGVQVTLARKAFPFDGSAILENSGIVRLGIFLHQGARRPELFAPDHLLQGKTDENFSGTLHLKVDGEIYPYVQLTFEPEDCSAIVIP